jgi:hypothetical protein
MKAGLTGLPVLGSEIALRLDEVVASWTRELPL